MQLGASDGHPGLLQAVPQLSKLELARWCALLDTDSGALTAALTGLSGLRHLGLLVHNPPAGQGPVMRMTALAQLTHLQAPT